MEVFEGTIILLSHLFFSYITLNCSFYLIILIIMTTLVAKWQDLELDLLFISLAEPVSSLVKWG